MLWIQSEDVINHERSVYTFLDLLGEVGGLMDALIQILALCLYLLSFITNEGPHNYVISRLFTTRGMKTSSSGGFRQKLK